MNNPYVFLFQCLSGDWPLGLAAALPHVDLGIFPPQLRNNPNIIRKDADDRGDRYGRVGNLGFIKV